MVKETPLTQREQLHQLVDQVPESRWAELMHLLRKLTGR
jgi:hypothetical protein